MFRLFEPLPLLTRNASTLPKPNSILIEPENGCVMLKRCCNYFFFQYKVFNNPVVINGLSYQWRGLLTWFWIHIQCTSRALKVNWKQNKIRGAQCVSLEVTSSNVGLGVWVKVECINEVCHCSVRWRNSIIILGKLHAESVIGSAMNEGQSHKLSSQYSKPTNV